VTLDRLREQGADFAAVYLSPWVKPEHREPLRALAASRPAVERAAGPAWEYVVFDLRIDSQPGPSIGNSVATRNGR
jgi:hypothetical protein